MSGDDKPEERFAFHEFDQGAERLNDRLPRPLLTLGKGARIFLPAQMWTGDVSVEDEPMETPRPPDEAGP